MEFHHMAVFVTDMDRSLELYRDLLGFRVIRDFTLPDGPGPGSYMDGPVLDDIFGAAGSRSRAVLARGDGGALLELQQVEVPAVTRTPDRYLRYTGTGITELALGVADIDGWFERVRAAGYETQTDYVWEYAGLGRSFLFYDPDGALIQLCEDYPRPARRTEAAR